MVGDKGGKLLAEGIGGKVGELLPLPAAWMGVD